MPIDGAPEDTICAIATPVGEGGIGIVRVSGQKAADVADKVVRLQSNRSLRNVSSHTLYLADILGAHTSSGSLPTPPTRSGESDLIDEGLVVYMKAPRSFTAEDVVEIHCHGSGIVLRRICEACVAAGARLAQPGEFTKRAFLNGRLDLSQAEAVLDTIKSKSDLGLRLAQRQLRGELGQQVNRLRSCLTALLAHVEAGIDFSGEDIAFVGRAELVASLQDASAQIQKMLATAETGRVLRDGARVVIVGKPNVGKSSLLNCLLRENRAIVTDTPGTTRDLIEESVNWQGLRITLVDTAGLRETSDAVEREGINRSKGAQEQADMILHVLDAAELTDTGVENWTFPALVREDVLVLNKTDLIDPTTAKDLVGRLSERTNRRVFPISVRSGQGLADLQGAIESQFLGTSLESNDGVVVTNMRHRVALERAAASIEETLTSIHGGVEPECVAVDLRGASDALGEIVGAITSDEVLEQIFSEFCIGK
ncbi:MAG: tRNA uridine-5-carboxymethylaminomethyl(34) synthesis GTPase MnmE [Nitrospira sp.]